MEGFSAFPLLRINQRVPNFLLPDSQGVTRSLVEFLESGNLLLFFFPFAFSGISDREVCRFRDDGSLMLRSGFRPVGISDDSIYALGVFAHTYDIPFPLLSDFNKKVSRAYGVLQNVPTQVGYKGVTVASAFLIDARRILRFRWVAAEPSEEPPYSDILNAAKVLKA